jgi:flagellar biosynthesis/type III secretory pathway protein FliH
MQPVTIHLPLPIRCVDVLGGQLDKPLDDRAQERVAEIQADCERQIAEVRLQADQQLAAERATVQQAAHALRSAAAELEASKRQLTAEMEAAALDLALQIARRIVHAEIDAARHDIEAVVRQAVKQLPHAGAKVVHLHPADFQRASQSISDEDDMLRLVADPQIAPGHCLVESEVGSVEHDPDEALDTIEKQLKDDA